MCLFILTIYRALHKGDIYDIWLGVYNQVKAESSAQFCPKYPEERDTFFEIDVKKPGIIKENIPHKMQTAGLALQITCLCQFDWDNVCAAFSIKEWSIAQTFWGATAKCQSKKHMV